MNLIWIMGEEILPDASGGRPFVRCLSLLLLLLSSIAAHSREQLVIYTYDSWMAPGGIGPEVIPLFESKCQCRVRVLPSGDGAAMLNRIELDAGRGKIQADLAIGIDQNLWPRAKRFAEPWGEWRPKRYEEISPETRVGAEGEGFLPFDYGVFAFMADVAALKELGLEAPRRFSDLLKPEWKKRILIQDPRVSTPGLALVLGTWTLIEGSRSSGEFGKFWSAFRSQWLTLAPGWDSAYGLFMKGEAPLVWSYSTSEAYHRSKGSMAKGQNGSRYRALPFEDGHPVQIEGAIQLKKPTRNESQRKLARKFLEFLISREVQEKIPERNWMMPAVSSTKLPKSFDGILSPKKRLRSSYEEHEVQAALRSWEQAVRGN